jgi:hypothetical protein
VLDVKRHGKMSNQSLSYRETPPVSNSADHVVETWESFAEESDHRTRVRTRTLLQALGVVVIAVLFLGMVAAMYAFFSSDATLGAPTSGTVNSGENRIIGTHDGSSEFISPAREDEILKTIFGVFAALVLVGVTLAAWGRWTRCPACQRFWAARRVRSELLSRSRGYGTVTRQDIHRDSDHRMIGISERQEQVHVIRDVVRQHYHCKYCLHEWTQDGIIEREG